MYSPGEVGDPGEVRGGVPGWDPLTGVASEDMLEEVESKGQKGPRLVGSVWSYS